MRKFLCVLLSIAFVFAVTGCSSSKERDDWQQYRATKGQSELSTEVDKSGAKE